MSTALKAQQVNDPLPCDSGGTIMIGGTNNYDDLNRAPIYPLMTSPSPAAETLELILKLTAPFTLRKISV
jgi:hypothetical protein